MKTKFFHLVGLLVSTSFFSQVMPKGRHIHDKAPTVIIDSTKMHTFKGYFKVNAGTTAINMIYFEDLSRIARVLVYKDCRLYETAFLDMTDQRRR